MNLNETLEGILYMNIGRFAYFKPKSKMLIFLTHTWNLPSTLLRLVNSRQRDKNHSNSSSEPDKRNSKLNQKKYPGKINGKDENATDESIIKQQKMKPND